MSNDNSTPERICSIPGCGKRVQARGWCSAHWSRWSKYGSPTGSAPKKMPSRKQTLGAHGYLVARDDAGQLRYVHLMVAEKAIGRALLHPEEVHHVDEDKTNNTGANLVICHDRAYHLLIHRRTEAMQATGNPAWRRCNICKKWDDPNNMNQWPRGKDSMHRHAACQSAKEAARVHAMSESERDARRAYARAGYHRRKSA